MQTKETLLITLDTFYFDLFLKVTEVIMAMRKISCSEFALQA